LIRQFIKDEDGEILKNKDKLAKRRNWILKLRTLIFVLNNYADLAEVLNNGI
jgi:hypothetical protein